MPVLLPLRSGIVSVGECRRRGPTDHTRRPRSPIRGPGDPPELQDAGVFGPGAEVLGGKGVEEGLGFVGGGVGWVDPVGCVEDAGFRVGVPALDYGVSCFGVHVEGIV